jgi:hypothetical protein
MALKGISQKELIEEKKTSHVNMILASFKSSR